MCSPAQQENRSFGTPASLYFIILLAVVSRVCAAAYLPDQHFPDAAAYRAQAESILNFHRLDDHYIMPLYPLALALFRNSLGQLIFDIGMSVLTVLLVYLLTFSIFRSKIAGLFAAASAAAYPHFIFYAVVGLTETLFMALVLAAFTFWYRGMFFFAAVAAVLSVLTRPTIDPLPLILIPYFAIVIHRLSIAATIKQLAIYAAVYCALLAPWWIHNYSVYGEFVRLNLGFGQALYFGNNLGNKTGGVTGTQVDMSQFDKIADPVKRDRALSNAAREFILADPLRFVHLAELKFLRFWRLWPFAEPYSGSFFVIVSLLSFLPVLILALYSLVHFGLAQWIRVAPIVGFGCYLTAVHMIIVGSVRYRLPVEPFLMVLAAPTLVKLVEFIAPRLPIADIRRLFQR